VKLVASTLLVLVSYSILCAQSPAENPSGAEVVKSSWNKVRIGWERDPFAGPLENFDEMRSRARNERRVAQGGGDRAKRDAKADEANLAALRDKAPSRYYFVYKAKIKNNSTTAIVELDWDYVFFERGTENELGRREFTTDEQIAPGKTRELTVTTLSPPTRTVSLSSLNLGEHDQFTERIQLVRIKYADGRVWQPQ
jgi:hypothetical protein